MENMPTERGLGRGRGRGKALAMPNGLDDNCASSINPPSSDELPSIANGVSRGRGRGLRIQVDLTPSSDENPSISYRIAKGRGRGRVLPTQVDLPLPPSPDDPPSIANGVARGRGRGRMLQTQEVMPLPPAPPAVNQPETEPPFVFDHENVPTLSGRDIKIIKRILKSASKPSKVSKSEQRDLCQMWTFPRGITNPILVLSMNEYLDTDELFIPGEICFAPFTLKDGINLNATYWTLVNPSEDISPEYIHEVDENIANFGLPRPSASSRQYQNYEDIVGDIEAFIKTTSHPIDEDQDTHVIFCQKEFLSSYNMGLDWIYSKAGKEKFPHKLVSLELVLVMLSHGGLRQQVGRKGFGGENLSQILTSFTYAVNSIKRSDRDSTSQTSQTVVERFDTVEYILSKLKDSFVSRMRFTQYISLGDKGVRLAGRRVAQHPQAFLGAFLSEGQAVRYLEQKDYIFKDHLACAFHQERDQIWECARFNVARLIYTCLDVLLVNYEIMPVEGRHFPRFSYYSF